LTLTKTKNVFVMTNWH